MRTLAALLALVTTACAQVGPYQHTDTILSNLKGGYRGDTFIDLGHNPDLGLTSNWLGAVTVKDEFVDTDTDRTALRTLWTDLRALDVGNSVSTNAALRFSGGTVQQWYVATDGNDTTGDGTSGTPWATIGKAWTQVPSTPSQNYQINVAAGTYLSALIDLTGKTIADPYYVRIVGSGYPVLSFNQTFIDDGETLAEGAGYNFGVDTAYLNDGHYDALVEINVSNVEIRGFRMIGARHLLPQSRFSENVIRIRNTDLQTDEKIIIADCEISQGAHGGIKGFDTGSGGIVYIDGNFLHDNGLVDGQDHQIYPTGTKVEIRRNLMVNTDGNGINGNDSDLDAFTVTHNVFMANTIGVAISGKDWEVQHNITYGNDSGGIQLYRAGIDADIRNNVLYEDLANTATVAVTYDTSGSTGAYLNRPPFAALFDYNYVETGSTVTSLSLTLPDDITPWSSTTDMLKKRVLVTGASRYYEITDYTALDETGASAPTAESSWATGITDGDLTLRYLGTSLSNNTYTNTTTGDDSASAVFGDAANYDFRFESGQGSVGTDLGYDNGTLVGVWTTTK